MAEVLDVELAEGLAGVRMYERLPAWRSRVAAMRAFGLDGKTEGSYWEVPLVYNKSLLYIVSSLCEDDPNADKPIVGMQRYWSDAKPYIDPEIRAVTSFIQGARSVWSPTNAQALPGYRSSAKKHGGFAQDTETRLSVSFALHHGF